MLMPTMLAPMVAVVLVPVAVMSGMNNSPMVASAPASEKSVVTLATLIRIRGICATANAEREDDHNDSRPQRSVKRPMPTRSRRAGFRMEGVSVHFRWHC